MELYPFLEYGTIYALGGELSDMMITFYKTDNHGRVRYYTIHDRQGHLFTTHSLTVIWGKALTSGREKVYPFQDRQAMDNHLRKLFKERIQSGYRILYSFSRKEKYRKLFQDANETLAC